MPVSNVEDFCEWYKITRAHEVTINKICLFLGIDKNKHIEPQTKLFHLTR